MEGGCKELPEDCWELIVSRLGDHRQWESLSLVSKKLFSITNRLRVSLKVLNPLIEVFHNQLLRFQHVRKIDLSSFGGPLDEALLEIALSGVDIEELDISNKSNLPVTIKDLGFKMKNIKVLNCSYTNLKDSDLVILAESLPLIEELDIRRPVYQDITDVTDVGIIAISKKLKRLQTINLTGYTRISDQSLISLSANCESLTEIVLIFNKVSQAGFSYVMENSTNYNSLILSPATSAFVLNNPLNFSKSITTIDLSYMYISDEFLNGIVKADLPLQKFNLVHCQDYTLNGLYSLLKAYPSLKSLSLGNITDEFVRNICQFITKLDTINLWSTSLTCSSFIAITSACPHISKIKLEHLSEGEPSLDYASESAKNPSITSATVNGIALEEILNICPNLQILHMRMYSKFKDVDIASILNSCHNIRRLRVANCSRLKFTGEGDEEACNLELLDASNSKIDDDILKMVGKRCPHLLNLDLDNCRRVTERGVREVVEQCRRLRYVKLNWCLSVNKEFVAWMVASCPSLRQIVTPRAKDHSRVELDNFLRQGCLVIPGTYGKDYS